MLDPTVRRMRVVAAVMFLVLVAYVVIMGEASPTTLGTLVGASLIVLGFEVGVRLPGRGKDNDNG